VLRVSWLGTYVETVHDDRADVVGQGEIEIIHDQHLTIGEARVAADYGFTSQLGASLVVPVRFVSTTIRYASKATGEDVDLVMPGIHHRDETLVGVADPMLLGAFTSPVGAARITIRAGVSLPLGRTEDNPFTVAAETMPHEHIQMGTGTVRPVLSADASFGFGKWHAGGFLFTQQSIYENSRGYKTGDRYAAGASASRRIGTKWSLRGGMEVQGETAEHWQGVEHTDDGNRGRFDAMVSVGGSYLASERVAIDATIKIPFVTEAVGGQLDMPAIVEVGAGWTFGPKPKPGHHHHDHDDHDHDDHDHDEHVELPVLDAPVEPAEPTPTIDVPAPADRPIETAQPKPVAKPKADIAAVGAPGAGPDLVPVRGKITIFDFWAPWCVPCKKLDPVLVALAKKYPDKVALRKLDVVDWDSKTAARYLTPGGFDLPHVKIFDASGKRIFEKSSAVGKLDALIAEIRTLVEPR
jgi:thiol-disulfide isomerase/thioredoxin